MHCVEYPVLDNIAPGTASGSFALAITIIDNSVTLSVTLK